MSGRSKSKSTKSTAKSASNQVDNTAAINGISSILTDAAAAATTAKTKRTKRKSADEDNDDDVTTTARTSSKSTSSSSQPKSKRVKVDADADGASDVKPAKLPTAAPIITRHYSSEHVNTFAIPSAFAPCQLHAVDIAPDEIAEVVLFELPRDCDINALDGITIADDITHDADAAADARENAKFSSHDHSYIVRRGRNDECADIVPLLASSESDMFIAPRITRIYHVVQDRKEDGYYGHSSSLIPRSIVAPLNIRPNIFLPIGAHSSLINLHERLPEEVHIEADRLYKRKRSNVKTEVTREHAQEQHDQIMPSPQKTSLIISPPAMKPQTHHQTHDRGEDDAEREKRRRERKERKRREREAEVTQHATSMRDVEPVEPEQPHARLLASPQQNSITSSSTSDTKKTQRTDKSEQKDTDKQHKSAPINGHMNGTTSESNERTEKKKKEKTQQQQQEFTSTDDVKHENKSKPQDKEKEAEKDRNKHDKEKLNRHDSSSREKEKPKNKSDHEARKHDKTHRDDRETTSKPKDKGRQKERDDDRRKSSKVKSETH